MKDGLRRVGILLSTFNGEKYLSQQLDSLLAQQGVVVDIYIRDDGSTDSTRAILQGYSKRFANIKILNGHNIGFVKSFLELLSKSGSADYYAFCDQDDVWLPEKLYRAVDKLASVCDKNIPAMYFGRTEYVDENLIHIGYSPLLNLNKVGFGNAIVQNVATGCTIVVNSSARELCIASLPEACLFHDWWMYLLVSAFGVVIYDPDSFIKYRQHGGNVVGVPKSILDKFRRGFSRISRGDVRVSCQLREFEKIFIDKLSINKAATIRKIISYSDCVYMRPMLIVMSGFWRQTLFESIFLRFTMLIGRF